jgi:hypothetical protein
MPAKLIRLFAELMEGTQVPRSLGKGMLGAGTKPWDEIRNELHLFGWRTADEIEVKINEYLSKCKDNA